MKIRNGFVSNSSSSSFIIPNGNIATIANIMLRTVIEDWEELDQDTVSLWRKNAEKCHDNKDIQNGKVGIMLPSCNYETYIFKVNNDIYVDTCNNHQWPLEEMGGAIYSGEGTDGADKVHRASKSRRYFNVKNGLVHSRIKYSWVKDGGNKYKCPICADDPTKRFLSGEYVIYKKQKICANCYRGVLDTKKTIIWPEEEKTRKEDKKKADHMDKLKQKQVKVVNPLTHLEI
jgi:hypothetical protein